MHVRVSVSAIVRSKLLMPHGVCCCCRCCYCCCRLTHGPTCLRNDSWPTVCIVCMCVCCVCCVCLFLLLCLLFLFCLLPPSPRVPCCWSCIAAMARCGRLVRPRVHPLNVLHTCLVQAGSCCCRACACVCVCLCLCVRVCVLPQHPLVWAGVVWTLLCVVVR